MWYRKQVAVKAAAGCMIEFYEFPALSVWYLGELQPLNMQWSQEMLKCSFSRNDFKDVSIVNKLLCIVVFYTSMSKVIMMDVKLVMLYLDAVLIKGHENWTDGYFDQMKLNGLEE